MVEKRGVYLSLIYKNPHELAVGGIPKLHMYCYICSTCGDLRQLLTTVTRAVNAS